MGDLLGVMADDDDDDDDEEEMCDDATYLARADDMLMRFDRTVGKTHSDFLRSNFRDTVRKNNVYRNFAEVMDAFRHFGARPASQFSTERLFSVGSTVDVPRRNRLTPSKFEQLVVMKAASSRVGTTKIVDNRQVFA